jgi:hypothetical protein
VRLRPRSLTARQLIEARAASGVGRVNVATPRPHVGGPVSNPFPDLPTSSRSILAAYCSSIRWRASLTTPVTTIRTSHAPPAMSATSKRVIAFPSMAL